MRREAPDPLALLKAASAPTAILAFDAQQGLIRHEGDLKRFGIQLSATEPQRAEDLLPMLVGLDTTNHKSLEMIALGAGTPADIHVFPRADGYDVLLVDVSNLWSRQRPLQQRMNETLLANELQQRTEARASAHKLATLAHEIRNPLFNIAGYCDWLRETVPAAAGIDPQLRIITNNSRYLLDLLDDIMARDAGHAPSGAAAAAFNLGELLQEVIELFAHEAGIKGIGLNLYLESGADLWPVLDRNRLKQALLNLAGNAVKFTRDGIVSLSARRTGEVLNITIEDTGSGIPRDELEAVLQPFFRARNSSGVVGVGIGLSVVSEIVKELGGELRMASVEEWGTTVVLDLPCQFDTIPRPDPPNDRRTPGPASFDRAAEPTRQRILLIDDDEDVLRLLAFYLADSGYQVTPLAPQTIAEIIAEFQSSQPDLVVVDHHLDGGLSGADIAYQLRAKQPNQAILLLTSDTSADVRERAIAYGCNLVVSKPVSKKQLIEALGQILNPQA
ncbi:MAG: ATP-binding protein [Thiotrichales bacterium]